MPEPAFHPDLRVARFLPRAAVGPRTLPLIRLLTRLRGNRPPQGAERVRVEPGVSMFVFRPADAPAGPRPALLWVHGGGLVMGSAAQDARFCRRVADELGVVVAAVEYRLAPDYPFPTPLHDCWAALRRLADQTDVDPGRVAVGGASAGGGLAAALALLARERGDVRPVFQLLVYPMLDDRTSARTDVDESRLRMWNVDSNRFGWRSYLGSDHAADVSPLAAPARCADLSDLPPAWIGVGTNDLFHREDVAYADRLRRAGVGCELLEVPGAYHGFDAVQGRAGVSRAFMDAQVAALADGLGIGGRTRG